MTLYMNEPSYINAWKSEETTKTVENYRGQKQVEYNRFQNIHLKNERLQENW